MLKPTRWWLCGDFFSNSLARMKKACGSAKNSFSPLLRPWRNSVAFWTRSSSNFSKRLWLFERLTAGASIPSANSKSTLKRRVADSPGCIGPGPGRRRKPLQKNTRPASETSLIQDRDLREAMGQARVFSLGAPQLDVWS
jgi:hypothetical protein